MHVTYKLIAFVNPKCIFGYFRKNIINLTYVVAYVDIYLLRYTYIEFDSVKMTSKWNTTDKIKCFLALLTNNEILYGERCYFDISKL